MTTSGDLTLFPATAGNARPFGLTVGPDGALWLTMASTFGGDQAIGRMALDGQLTVFPLDNTGFANEITTGPDGNLWFTEDNDVIARMTTAGVVKKFHVGGNDTFGITAGPGGTIWFTLNFDDAIGRITLT
jgi:virginiamycin B lyase